MSRRRWVYRKDEVTGEVVVTEVGQEWEPTAPRAQTATEELTYGNMRATDGTDISSKRRHREYMRAHNLTTADDFKETWAKAAEDRASERKKNGDVRDPSRKEDIARAMHAVLDAPRGRRRK